MLKPKSKAYQKEQKNIEDYLRLLPNACKRCTSEDITATALHAAESAIRELRVAQIVLHELAVRLPGVVRRGPFPVWRGKRIHAEPQTKAPKKK